jgi:hypothetical protein
MKRIRPVTRPRVQYASIAVEVKLEFARDVIDVSIPLFQNKDPQVPADPDPTPTT